MDVNPASTASGTGSRDSQVPLVGTSNVPLSTANVAPTKDDGAEQDGKSRKRDFFRFGKKEDDKKKTKATTAEPLAAHTTNTTALRPASPRAAGENANPAGSPRSQPYGAPASPRNLRSTSPRTHSPASSMIFERNVQEDVGIAQASPQIPSHIVTENHIPPALDATSEAITDAKLDPDSVEVVTHALHQPAAVTITSGLHDQPISPVATQEGSIAPAVPRQDSDNASNYASLESGDVRRLSFISFADVVHAEHDMGEPRRDSGHVSGPTGLMAAPRSPSPMRSPVSSQVLGTSPPTSVSASVHEASPNRNTGELNFETMRQALRKTGSGDLSSARSFHLGTVGGTDEAVDRPLR